MSDHRIVWNVGARTAAFERNMKKVEQKMHRVGRQATFLGRDLTRSVTMPLVGAGAAVIATAIKTGQYADQLLDLEQITGMSTDALQEWRNVARVAGVDSDALSNAAGGLTRRIRGLEEGSGAVTKAFEKLGISSDFVEKNIDDTDKMMSEIISRMSGMEAGLQRASIANDIFGRRWEQIAPILGMSSDEIARAREEAHEFGLVLDRDALESANKFRIEMEKFQERMAASGRTMAMDFMPILTDLLPLAEQIVGSLQDKARAFTNLDKETQKNILRYAAYAAALGPALTLTGSMLTSVSRLTAAVRALTVAMAANPFIAVGAALTTVVALMASANRETQQFRKELQQVMDMTPEGTQNELTAIANKIAGVEEEIDRVRRTRRFANIEQRAQADEEIERLQAQINKLEELREKVALAQLDNRKIVDDEDAGNAERMADAVERTAEAARITRFQIANTQDGVIDIMEEFDRMAENRFLQEQAELWDFMLFGPENYEHKLEDVNEAIEQMDRDFTNFAHLGVQAFERLTFGGEKFLGTLKSISRQLATRGLLTLLTGGFGSTAGGFSGGIRQVLGINDGIITPKGDIISRHPDDYLIATKDPGKLAANIAGGRGGGSRVPIRNIVNLNGRVIYEELKEIEYQLTS